MLSNWEDLYDIAAEFMSPGNIAEGKRKLAAISKRAIRKIRFVKMSVFVTRAVLLALVLASAGVIIADVFLNHPVDQQFAHIISIKYAFWGFLSLIFALSVFLDFVQFHPELLPWLRLPAECHPKELIPLLDGLKSGIWKAKAAGGILPDYIYDSEWNILLFSGAEYKDERRWLCRPWRAAYPGDIEARRVLFDQFVSNSSMAGVTTTAEAASPLPDVILDTHQKEDVRTTVIGDPAELEEVTVNQSDSVLSHCKSERNQEQERDNPEIDEKKSDRLSTETKILNDFIHSEVDPPSTPVDLVKVESQQSSVIVPALDSKTLIEMDECRYDQIREQLETAAKAEKRSTRMAILRCLSLIDELRKPEYRDLPQTKVALILSSSAADGLRFSESQIQKVYSGNYEPFQKFIREMKVNETILKHE